MYVVRCSCIVWLKLKNRMPQSHHMQPTNFLSTRKFTVAYRFFPFCAIQNRDVVHLPHTNQCWKMFHLVFGVYLLVIIFAVRWKPFATMNITFECDLLFHFDEMCNNRGWCGRHIQREIVSTPAWARRDKWNLDCESRNAETDTTASCDHSIHCEAKNII